VPKLPALSKSWVMAGGGARNRTLVKMLNERLAPATVETADEAGLSADALEAQAFAYLPVRVLTGFPCALPATTGVSLAMAGGIVARP
jgi:anhydro-N-acetylmuramic acid kinase